MKGRSDPEMSAAYQKFDFKVHLHVRFQNGCDKLENSTKSDMACFLTSLFDNTNDFYKLENVLKPPNFNC